MDGYHPKRRKDKDNPYTISESNDGRYRLSFADGQGVQYIDEGLFRQLDAFELHDISHLNEVDRHYEHSEQTENSLHERAVKQPESVEETVMRHLQTEALHKAISDLPVKQKRRLTLYFFENMTYEQIAEMEGCKYQTVQESIYAALKNLKKFLK